MRRFISSEFINKAANSNTCENIATKASGDLCKYHYKDGILSRKISGDTFFVDYNETVTEALLLSLCKDAKKDGYYLPKCLSGTPIPDNIFGEEMKNKIRTWYNNPNDYELTIEPINHLKDYKCIKKEAIDALLEKSANRCYKMLVEKKIMYTNEGRYSYRCREKGEDSKEKGLFIAIHKSFLEEHNYDQQKINSRI